jgi:hypothetical protein
MHGISGGRLIGLAILVGLPCPHSCIMQHAANAPTPDAFVLAVTLGCLNG